MKYKMIDRIKHLESDSRFCEYILNEDSEKSRILRLFSNYPSTLREIWARYATLDLFQSESILTLNCISPTLLEFNKLKGIDIQDSSNRVYFHLGFGESYYDSKLSSITWEANGHKTKHFSDFDDWLDFFVDEYVDEDDAVF